MWIIDIENKELQSSSQNPEADTYLASLMTYSNDL